MIVANTKDPIIGKDCKLDIKAMRNVFGKIIAFTHFPLVEILIQGAGYTQQKILKALDGLKPKKNDFVIFYCTGNGFSYEKRDQKSFRSWIFAATLQTIILMS